jgi:hypothetical protein
MNKELISRKEFYGVLLLFALIIGFMFQSIRSRVSSLEYDTDALDAWDIKNSRELREMINENQSAISDLEYRNY